MSASALATVRCLYVHVPFCNGKCAYCAFYSEPLQDSMQAAWLQALAAEASLIARQCHLVPETIYFGGGTPSLLPPEPWQVVLDILQSSFDLTACHEWTIEANPGTLSDERLAIWKSAGITRISLGVQAFQDRILTRMNRRHTVQDVYDSVQTLRARTDWDISIDLIAGYPGVSARDWAASLDKAIHLAPDHLSVYACSLEAGTPLFANCIAGRDLAPTDRRLVRSLALATATLHPAGYHRYEISNYARSGHLCEHNRRIWLGEDYVGLGPAASSRVARQRWTNPPDITAYAQAVANGSVPWHPENLPAHLDAAERFLFCFRTKDPVHLDAYLPRTKNERMALQAHWQCQLSYLQTEGLVQLTPDGWIATDKGWLFADLIAESLFPS